MAGGYSPLACFRLWSAWAPDDGGPLLFRESANAREVKLPCGRCIGCMKTRQRSWGIRCMHEAQLHDASAFVTLTYNEEHYAPSLNYSDFRRFLWRLRKEVGPTRYFVAGEYGSKDGRPHWHALLFGRSFSDRVAIGSELFRSPSLERLWPLGFSSVGDVTPASAMYVAKYCTKVVRGDGADKHYSRLDLRTGEIVRVVPEFARMSLRPGIGAKWFYKYWPEVYVARDGVVMHGGFTVPAPRYYDALLDLAENDLMDSKRAERYTRAGKFVEDTSPARLAVREACAVANHNRKVGKL